MLSGVILRTIRKSAEGAGHNTGAGHGDGGRGSRCRGVRYVEAVQASYGAGPGFGEGGASCWAVRNGLTHPTGGDVGGAFLAQAHDLTHRSAGGASRAGAEVLGKGHADQQAEDGHHDHQFDQGEALGQTFALTQFAKQLELELGAHGEKGSFAQPL